MSCLDYEAIHDPIYSIPVIQSYINVPLGISDFPKEILCMPRSWWSGLGPIVHKSSFDKGGHFAAWECSEELAEAVSEMFGKGGGAEGVVEGKSGY